MSSFFNKHVFLKTVLSSAILLILLADICLFLDRRVTELLNETLEQNVARQAADLSLLAMERFDKELAALQVAADYLEKNSGVEAEKNFMESLKHSTEGITVGMTSLDGHAIHGISLSKWDFLRLPMAFRGNPIVDYSASKGLLFAVPVMREGNARAVIYRLYDNSVLSQLFGLGEYNADIRLLIQERNGQMIVPYKNYGSNDEQFFNEKSIQSGFLDVRGLLEKKRSAAVYSEGVYGRFFLFGADLPETNCSMVGYLPWSSVAGGIAQIYTLIIQVGVIILVLFILGICHLFWTQLKANESGREKQIADRANKAKSEFLANMSHEIRTPINAVLGMNEMILREEKDSNISRYAHNIKGAGESLLSIINDILDFSKIESGKLEVVPVKYQLSSLINDVVNMIRPRVQKKDLLLEIHVEPEIPDTLLGDSVRVKQVIVNLLTNAVKYTEKGKVTLSVSHTRQEDDTALLSFEIQDTGIGIREEDQKKLFQNFERFDLEKNRNIEGTGLGLAITYRLLELMNGRVELQSVYGEGSTFTATLPQKILDEAAIGNFEERMKLMQEQDVYSVSFNAPDAEILVVDDNEMNLFVVTGLLKETLVKIDTCQSGEDALKKLKEKRYDVVFLDHMMAGMDGIETLHRAKELPNAAGTPFIILTANAIAGAREMFLKEGFNDYLSKPINGTLLEKTLARYLPREKVKSAQPVKETAGAVQNNSSDQTVSEEENQVMDIKLGLKYSGGNEVMFWKLTEMFCKLRPGKQQQIRDAFAEKDWKKYTTLVHALKSTSLSIGGRKLSEAAKELELSGKQYMAEASSEEEKKAALDFIAEHHETAMKLYDEFAETATERLEERNQKK